MRLGKVNARNDSWGVFRGRILSDGVNGYPPKVEETQTYIQVTSLILGTLDN